ncbi:MAG TPA: 23S rRNA (pseudouridine(1915)-N(3))-methyltransferase RlmH, partial [Acidobacteriota bacterium]|nr:23S rRNA (pseudouridine(1915)-N(3))-methyltransferase RlmH [Acidobacteriota bacterium]
STGTLADDYLKRIRRWAACDVMEARDIGRKQSIRGAALIESEGTELIRHIPDTGRIVALDENGVHFSSIDFARWLESEQNSGARPLVFVIGGHEGLSRKVKDRAHLVLSLGRMTWPHEICRVLLFEQVYRAFCIIHNVPYHKGGE